MPDLARQPVLHALSLPHRDARGDQAPCRGLVRVGPVDGTERGEHPLQPPDDRIAQADVGPARAVDVETQDARHLALHLSSARIAVNLTVDAQVGTLREADADRLPPGVGEKCEMQVPPIDMAFGRRFVPGADEVGARPK